MFEGLLQPTHLMVIMVIALIVLGPGTLGDLGGQLGRGMREFKQNINADGDPRSLSSAGRFCTHCGASHDASAQFCPTCGAKAAGTV